MSLGSNVPFEDEGSTFLPTAGNHYPTYTASCSQQHHCENLKSRSIKIVLKRAKCAHNQRTFFAVIGFAPSQRRDYIPFKNEGHFVRFKIIGLDYAACVIYVFCAENNTCGLLVISDGMLVPPYGVTYAESIRNHI